MKPIRSEDINVAVFPIPLQGLYTLANEGLENSEVTIYDYGGITYHKPNLVIYYDQKIHAW